MSESIRARTVTPGQGQGQMLLPSGLIANDKLHFFFVISRPTDWTKLAHRKSAI